LAALKDMLAELQGTKPVTEKKKSTGGNGVVSSLFNRSVLKFA